MHHWSESCFVIHHRSLVHEGFDSSIAKQHLSFAVMIEFAQRLAKQKTKGPVHSQAKPLRHPRCNEKVVDAAQPPGKKSTELNAPHSGYSFILSKRCHYPL